jgi:hypothetical protein
MWLTILAEIVSRILAKPIITPIALDFRHEHENIFGVLELEDRDPKKAPQPLEVKK